MPKILTLTSALLFVFLILAEGQQNSTLFFMLSTPQANFVNPAVRNECKWMLGLPVLSSVHAELGNSSFSFHQLLTKQPDNTYLFNGNGVMNRLGRTNYLTAEAHANLLFVSFWQKKNFFTFSINEKADLFVTYPRDLFDLAWEGNTQFVGQTAELGRSAVFLNYRREFAVGIARQPSADLVWGIRAKLLFGKLNTSVTRSKVNLYTDPVTYDLNFNSRLRVNTSLPINVVVNPDNTFSSVSYNGNVRDILLNRRNVGLAFDLGFIKYRDENVTIAGSLLDLGLIRWSSNGYTLDQNGSYFYDGPLNDTATNQNSYIRDLTNTIKNDFGITVKSRPYISFLNPMYYIGATYALAKDLNAGALLSGRINRYRITSGLTLSLNKTFKQRLSVSLSYSYLYKSLKNIGLGVKLGKSPVQLYAVSDNILGLIKPLDTKNINIRFGLQFNFGCSHKEKIGNCGCYWLREAEERRVRNQRLLKKKQI
jgi:hypothetical protein